MAIAKKNPYLFPFFNKFFDDLFYSENSDWKRDNFSPTNSTLPDVNIIENEKNLEFEMAAPGLEKDNFSILIEKNQLIIRSEKTLEKTAPLRIYVRREFSYLSFQRVFNLPEHINENQIQASYQNGILTITIDKLVGVPTKRVRKINVN